MNSKNVIALGYEDQLARELIEITAQYFIEKEKIDFSRSSEYILLDEKAEDDAPEAVVYKSTEERGLKLIDVADGSYGFRRKVLDEYRKRKGNSLFVCVFSAGYLLTEQDTVLLKDIYTALEEDGSASVLFVVDTGQYSDEEDSEDLRSDIQYIKGKLEFLFKNGQGFFDSSAYDESVFFVDLKKLLVEINNSSLATLLEDSEEFRLFSTIGEAKEPLQQESVYSESAKEEEAEEEEVEEQKIEEPIKESEGSYGLVKEKTRAIASIIEDVSTLIGKRQDVAVDLRTGGSLNQPGINLVEKSKDLSERAQDIQKGIFKLMVLGAFSNGKSTLINALLGEKILKSKNLPTTSIVTILVHGSSTDVVIRYEDGKTPDRMSLDAFFKDFTLSREDKESIGKQGFTDRFENIKYAQIERDYRLLENGVRLIDSPGIEDQRSRTELVLSYLRECQAVILVLNATQLLTQSEQEFIETELAGNSSRNLFFVVNKINLVDEEEVDEVKDYLRGQIQHYFVDEYGNFDSEYYGRRVFFVDARSALDIRMGQESTSNILDSGLPELETELERFLTSSDKNEAAFEATFQSLSGAIAEARNSISKQKYAVRQPLEELKANRVKTEKLLGDLETQKKEIEKTIVTSGQLIGEKTFSSLLFYTKGLKETWEDDAKEISLEQLKLRTILKTVVSKEAKERIGRIIQEEIEKYLKQKLTAWAKDEIPTLIQEDVEKMMSTVERQVESFQFELVQISNLFSTGELLNDLELDTEKGRVKKTVQSLISIATLDVSGFTGNLLGQGGWMSFISRTVINIIVVTITTTLLSTVLNITAPIIFIIVYAVAELAHVGIQQASFEKRLVQSIGENLHKSLPEEVSKQYDTIRSKIQDQFIQQARGLTLSLQSQIDDKRAEQEDILNQKRQKVFSVQQEEFRLNSIDRRLEELLETFDNLLHK